MATELNKHASSDYIYKLYRKYLPSFSGASHKGLFLLPPQTGSGKTYATAKIIKDLILENEEINVIYLINNKDEREEVYNQILELGENDATMENFSSSIYMLESNEDNLFKAFNQRNDFLYLSRLKEFAQLKRKITLLSYLKRKNEDNLYTSYKDEDTNLKEKLKRIYKNPSRYNYDLKKLSKLIDEAKLLYPTIGLKKRAIITTTQKFLNKIYDLKGSYYLFDKNKGNTIIFMDEFDTQKNVILDAFIKEVAKKGIDSFEFIKTLSESLHTDIIERYFSNESAIYEVKKQIDTFYEQYNLKNKIKFKTDDINKDKFFLRDTNLISIGKNSDKYIFSISKNSINIVKATKTIEEGEIDFLKLFSDANKLIARFLGLVGSLKRDSTQGIEGVENEEKIYNFFYEILNGTDFQIHNIINRIYRETKKSSRRKIFQSQLEKSYSSLYNILTFRDSDKHRSFTRFFGYTLDNTPDAFLSYLSKNHFIVGISATATIPTKVHNFNLEYLNDVLINITEKEKEELKNLYNKTKLKNREYRTTFLDSFIFSSIEEMSNKLIALELYKKDENFLNFIWQETHQIGKRTNYFLSRYLEFVYVYKNYCQNDDINTFLYLIAANADEKMNLDLLRIMLNYMLIDNYDKISSQKKHWFRKVPDLKKKSIRNSGYKLEELNIVFAKAKGSKSWKDNLKSGLITKMFLVSNYTHMSKAQNLQYPFMPKGIEPKKGVVYEKDFDAIYCGEITNLMNTKIDYDKNSKEELLLKLLHNTTILECSGEISLYEKTKFLKEILKGIENPKSIYKDTNDYVNACMISIIQSIGRLHRTNFKGTTHMYFNHNNKEILQKFDYQNHILLPALEHSIKESSVNSSSNSNRDNNINIEAKIKGINANLSYFKALVNNPKNGRKDVEIAIKEWEDIRAFILKNPSLEKIDNSEHRYFLNSYNRYWYKEENDYKEVSISADYKTGYSEVSIENSRLKKLYFLEELKECFEENEIKTEFEYSNLMTPIVYNNFYKGAIGEVFGKFIFKKFLNIKLKNINFDSKTPYETFDYTNDKETVYIDFKYFNTYTASNIQNTDRLICKIKDKLVRFELTPKAVLIINLFVDTETKNEFSSKIEKIDNIYIVPWLIKEENSHIELDKDKIIEVGALYDKYTNK